MRQCNSFFGILFASVALGTMLLLAACGGTAQAPSPIVDPGASAAPALGSLPSLAELDSLPALGNPRGSSMAAYHGLNSTPVAMSANVDLQQGKYAHLQALENKLEWVIYRCDPDELKAYSTGDYWLFYTANGREPYIAQADFDQDKWVIVQGGDDPNYMYLTDLKQPQYHSADGQAYFALLAWDGSDVQFDQMRVWLDTGIGLPATVFELNNSSDTAVVELDGRPGIAFSDGGVLKFAHAATAAPETLADWTVTTLSELDYAGSSLDAVVVDGVLYVLYVADDNALHLASFSDTPAMGMPGASDEVIDDEGNLYMFYDYVRLLASADYLHACWAIIDYEEADGNGMYYEVMYGERPLVDFVGWNTTQISAIDQFSDAEPAMVLSGGLPQLAWHNATDMQLHFAYGLRGDNGKLTWTERQTGIDCPPDDVELQEVGGKPALLFVDNGNGLLTYALSDKLLPQNASDWVKKSYASNPQGTLISGMFDGRVLNFMHIDYGASNHLTIEREMADEPANGGPRIYLTGFGSNLEQAVYGGSVGLLQGQPMAAWVESSVGQELLRFGRCVGSI
jgi:hypothetical protein